MFIEKRYPTASLDELSICGGEYGAQSSAIEYHPNRPRYVRITDINEDGSLNNDYASSANIKDDEQYRLKYGDFLFARMGATVGKTYAYTFGDQIYAGYLIRYRLNLEKILPEYLFAFTRLNCYWKWVSINQNGAAQPGINAKKYGSLYVPVPPIEEQKKFIELSQQIDKSKFLLQQILEKFELLKKSRFIEMFGNVATNNKRWEKTKLGNKSVIGSSKRIFANEYTTEGIPFYRSKEIIELGMGEKPSVELYISKKRYQEIKEKFGIPIPGDILMTAVGTIGKFWIVPNSKPFYYKDGNLVYIRTKEFNPLFLKKLLEMLIEKYKVENANGSAYTALTIEKLKDLQIVLPPMTLQKQYEEFHIQIDKSKFNVFQDQTAAQVKVIVVYIIFVSSKGSLLMFLTLKRSIAIERIFLTDIFSLRSSVS